MREQGSIIIAILVILGIVFLLGICIPNSEGAEKHRRCDFPWRKSTKAKVATLRCWSEERGVDGDRVLRIARCESGADLADRYQGDGHAGVLQHVVELWPDRAKNYGIPGADINSTWAQAKVSTGMMQAGGWGHWACQ